MPFEEFELAMEEHITRLRKKKRFAKSLNLFFKNKKILDHAK